MSAEQEERANEQGSGRRVHEDVEALEAAGLVDRDEAGLRAEYEAFDVQMRVAL